MHYFKLYKPYGFLCQFTGEEHDQLLGDLYDFPKTVYSIGRLDKDSEGLLLLTDDNRFKAQILEPDNKTGKTYWVQVEGEITDEAIKRLSDGSLVLNHKGKSYTARKGFCERISPPNIPDRNPPIRYRATVPTSWIALTIFEGKNRQVRKMTAAVGFPTLRLIRYSIGPYTLEGMTIGDVTVFKP